MHGGISQGFMHDTEIDDSCVIQKLIMQTGKSQCVTGMHILNGDLRVKRFNTAWPQRTRQLTFLLLIVNRLCK